LVLGGGVVVLGLQGRAELDAGLEVGAGLADRLERAVQLGRPGARSRRRDSTISTAPISCRFFMICGSKLPSWPRGTSILTSPVPSVSSVFDPVPFRMLPPG
jgi:hypothetical protein